MPTYDYQCKDCGHAFEAQQAFTDDALTECPSCGGALKKKFGSVGIAFKGSGFYKNDARGSSGSSTPSTAPSAPLTSTGSDSSKSSDSSSSSSSGSTSSSSSSSDSGSTSTPSAS